MGSRVAPEDAGRSGSGGGLGAFVPLGVMLIALLLIYRRLVAGWVLAGGDLHTYFFPYWAAAARAFQDGALPLWNPYLFAGAPLLANSQAAIFYPLNWPFWLLSGPALSGMAASLHWSVLLHLLLAACTTFLLARRLGLTSWGAALAGLLYAGSGFLGVHVEHLNQLQGLAWMPLAFLPSARSPFRASAGNVLAFALILLTGHTQTAFITALGVIVFYTARYFLSSDTSRITDYASRITYHIVRLGLSLFPFALAALIAAVQLLPTFELSGFSMRAGGLPWREAVSFSVVPWRAHHVFLPPYLFDPDWPEGVAYLGLLGLALAGWQAWQRLHRLWMRHSHPDAAVVHAAQDRVRWAVLILGGMGLFLALGGYNPLYLLAVRLGVPGLVHFRAPARYLALYVLAASLLAGFSLSDLSASLSLTHDASRMPHRARWLPLFAFLLVYAELLISADALPHADATVPRAYDDLRPATAHLVAAAQQAETTNQPPGRFLSISKILFEPGDKGEIEGLYGPLLSPDALWSYFVAVKAREVLAPNLPLAFGVPAVDGYDGGLLPLHHYAAFSQLLLPEGTLDGRLRENLTAIPEGRWLSLLDVRFLITDKVGDLWSEDVFYDRQFQPDLAPGEVLSLAWLPGDFEANTLGLLYQGTGTVDLTLDDGRALALALPADAGAEAPYYLTWDNAAVPLTVTLRAGTSGLQPTGGTLIDDRTGAFYPLVLSPDFRLAHSGDVKLYENLHTLPRAFLVHEVLPVPDDAEGLAAMADPAFDPASELVVLAPALDAVPDPGMPASPESVEILAYGPSHVVLKVQARADGFLLLTDAWYPGWQVAFVSMDGGTSQSAQVAPLRADLLFRAVPVMLGDWTITFTYRPRSLYLGAVFSAVGLLGLTLFYWRERHARVGS